MTADASRIRGWHVLASMLAFFGAVIAVNVTFAVYAVRSFPGEDVRRSYLQGLRYNETLAERRIQAALGWTATTMLLADAGGALLEVRLTTRDGAPIEGASLQGELQRPATAQYDRGLSFEPLGRGRYVARLGALEAGRWRLRAVAEKADAVLNFESELSWRTSP